jgi:hypothetical protein
VQQEPKPIALIAGSGDLPRRLIDVFKSQHRPYVILAFKGQTEESLVIDHPHLWVYFGEVGKSLDYFKKNKIKEIVMAGKLTRPAFSEMKPDWEGVKWLAKLGSNALGDDHFLKVIIDLIESKGYQIVGPDHILEALIVPSGTLTEVEPDEKAWIDIQRGVEVLKALSPVDVGQAVVVQDGLVLGVEAIEGTDALIERAGKLQRPGPGGILIKMAKIDQEDRVDLPTIGVDTIMKVASNGFQGIALNAGKALILDKKAVLKLADEKGLFLLAL